MLGTFVGTSRQVGIGRVERNGQIVGIVIALNSLCPCLTIDKSLVACHVANHDQQAFVAVGADGINIAVGCRTYGAIGTFIRNARQFAGGYHRLNLRRIGHPVLQKDARRAGHGQQVGIGCQRVLTQRVLNGIGTLLGVVVLDKGNGIPAILPIVLIAAHQRPVAVVLLTQTNIVALIHGIAHGVAELEVECCTLNLVVQFRTHNPVLDGCSAVPAFTDGEFRLRSTVIKPSERSRIAFHHVITETGIAQVVLQEVEIGLDYSLHILALMVKVTHAVPAFS